MEFKSGLVGDGRYVVSDNLDITNINVLDDFGLVKCPGGLKVEDILLSDHFKSKLSFESFVEETYNDYFVWLDCIEGEGLKKALYARLWVNIYLHYDISPEGSIECKNKRFYNGDIYIPKSIEDGFLNVYRSSYFTTFAFRDRIKFYDKNTCDHEWLSAYKSLLMDFDISICSSLTDLIKKDGILSSDLNIYFGNAGFITYISLSLMLKLSDGYLFVSRGSGVVGAGDLSTSLTGILESTNPVDTLDLEIHEEFGYDLTLSDVRYLGYGIIEDVDKNFSNKNLVFYYDVDLGMLSSDFLYNAENAIDSHEIGEVFIIEDILGDLPLKSGIVLTTHKEFYS